MILGADQNHLAGGGYSDGSGLGNKVLILLIIQREPGVLRWNADLPAMGRPWRLDEEA